MQTVWVEVTTRTQRQLVRLLDDDTTFIQTEGGAVVLDLRPIVIQIGDQVAVIGKVAERLPESAGRIAIIEESQLETAQTATKALRAVADWMWLVALAGRSSARSGWPADAAGSSCGRSRSDCSSSGF